MNKISTKEFNNYLKENLTNYSTFYEKALEFQNLKNSKRQKKWNDGKLEKEANMMWDKVANNIYNQISLAARNDKVDVLKFIENNNILSDIDEQMANVDFTEDN